MTMPEKMHIYQTGYGIKRAAYPFDNAIEYVRHDLYEALEADNKRLAGAVLDFVVCGDLHVKDMLNCAIKKHAEAIALAQRIGGK